MAGKDIIMASQRELKQLHVVQKAIDGELKQTEAAELLSLSLRQTGRIIIRVKEEGPQGVVHRSRGRESTGNCPKRSKIRCWRYTGRTTQGLVRPWPRRSSLRETASV